MWTCKKIPGSLHHEMRLRLEGATPLPSEWVVYLEREHREILQQMKRLGDVESNAPSTSTHNISEYASGLNSTHDVRSPCHWQDKERIHRSVLPEIDGTFYIYKINPLSRLTNNYSWSSCTTYWHSHLWPRELNSKRTITPLQFFDCLSSCRLQWRAHLLIFWCWISCRTWTIPYSWHVQQRPKYHYQWGKH